MGGFVWEASLLEKMQASFRSQGAVLEDCGLVGLSGTASGSALACVVPGGGGGCWVEGAVGFSPGFAWRQDSSTMFQVRPAIWA